jgi:hypothetical protein
MAAPYGKEAARASGLCETEAMHVRVATMLVSLLSLPVLAQQDGLTPPPPPPDVQPEQPQPQPQPQQPGVLVPKTIANAPLEPEKPAPAASGSGHFIGPMLHVGLNFVNRVWDSSFPVLPGFGFTLGLRGALLERSDQPQFNMAVGGFFGLEAINFVPVFSPGVRFELLGLRGRAFIPWGSFGAFSQLLVPANGDPVGVRGGLVLAWNLAAVPGNMPWWRGSWGSGGGGSAWILIPIAVIAAVIAFGDVRVFVQTSPVGGVIGGLSIGVGL